MGAKLRDFQTVAKVVRDGRISVPIHFREALGIRDGDKILVTISEIEE